MKPAFSFVERQLETGPSRKSDWMRVTNVPISLQVSGMAILLCVSIEHSRFSSNSHAEKGSDELVCYVGVFGQPLLTREKFASLGNPHR